MSPQVESGPYVCAALLCDRVLQEQDGTISIIRVIDTINHSIPPGSTSVLQIPVDATLVLALRSGGYEGPGEITLRIVKSEDGSEVFSAPPVPVAFGGRMNGPTMIFNLAGNTFLPGPGEYWFEAIIGDAVITKIPLRLNVTESESLMQPVGSG